MSASTALPAWAADPRAGEAKPAAPDNRPTYWKVLSAATVSPADAGDDAKAGTERGTAAAPKGTAGAPRATTSAPKVAAAPKTGTETPKAPPKPAPPDDGAAYKVGKFVLLYKQEHAGLPPIDEIAQIPIHLGETPKGYVAPREGATPATIHLADFNGGRPSTFFAGAIQAINVQIVKEFNRRGLVGIYVAPHEDDLDPKSGEDKRKAQNTTLRLVVWSAVVSRVRTLASGERIPSDERIDSPKHARIRERSPLQEKDLLNKSKLDDYVYFLSRHPGRRVDVAVTSGEKAGEVGLDYLVSENKPWLAYAQTSNTGTESTAKWRHRFGFIHNQLTGNDDILSGEYTTDCFDEPVAQSASGSYEAPFFGMDRLRWRVYGSWGRFEASINSGSPFGQNYTGHEWRLGGEMAANVFQHKQTFLDLVGGVTWWHILTNNVTTDITGDADAFLPYAGMRVERLTDLANTVGSVTVEWNCQSIAGSDRADYERLGRTDPDPDWVLLKWDLFQSLYLEPLLNPERWRDLSSKKDSWKSSTLAHEVAFQFRGQYAMNGYRMIPHNERVVGGFFTVRGYPESTVAGDTALIGTAEYRLHIPRLLKPLNLRGEDEQLPRTLPLVGTPFRWAPQTVFGRPDWDLIFRTFFDIGRATNVDRTVFEKDYTLIGAGIGIEVQFTRYINVRCDWGIPCRGMESSTEMVEPGDSRVHFVATILY